MASLQVIEKQLAGWQQNNGNFHFKNYASFLFGLFHAFLANQQVVFVPCNLHPAKGPLFVKGRVFNCIFRTEIVSLQLFNL